MTDELQVWDLERFGLTPEALAAVLPTFDVGLVRDETCNGHPELVGARALDMEAVLAGEPEVGTAVIAKQAAEAINALAGAGLLIGHRQPLRIDHRGGYSVGFMRVMCRPGGYEAAAALLGKESGPPLPTPAVIVPEPDWRQLYLNGVQEREALEAEVRRLNVELGCAAEREKAPLFLVPGVITRREVGAVSSDGSSASTAAPTDPGPEDKTK